MGVPRKQSTNAFKHGAVRLVTAQGLSLAQAARDLGIDDNLLGRWKKEFEAQGAKAFAGQGLCGPRASSRWRTGPPAPRSRGAAPGA